MTLQSLSGLFYSRDEVNFGKQFQRKMGVLRTTKSNFRENNGQCREGNFVKVHLLTGEENADHWGGNLLDWG